MWGSKTGWKYVVIGVVLGTGLWCWIGRVSLFHTASYTSRFSLGVGDLYQNDVLWLEDDAQVQQTFVPRFPGLHQVSVLLSSPQPLKEEAVVTLHLKPSCTSPDALREVTVRLSPEQVVREGFYVFTFAPLDAVVHQELCFVLSHETDPLSENSIGVHISQNDIYAEGQGTYTSPQKPVNGANTAPDQKLSPSTAYRTYLPLVHRLPRNTDFDIGFELYYRGTPFQTIQALAAQLTAHKPSIFGNPGFYLVLVIAYGVGLGFLLRVTRRE